MLPPENVFGHRRRLDWIREQLHPSDEVLDFGCGTGALITIPLLALGHRVTGIDIHHDSVAYGQALLERAGLDRHALKATDLVQLEGSFDVAIAAEVLEHLDDEELAWVLRLLHAKLKAGGRLLLTVPNGFGLFELESSAYELLRKHGPLKRIAVRRAGRPEGRSHVARPDATSAAVHVEAPQEGPGEGGLRRRGVRCRHADVRAAERARAAAL